MINFSYNCSGNTSVIFCWSLANLCCDKESYQMQFSWRFFLFIRSSFSVLIQCRLSIRKKITWILAWLFFVMTHVMTRAITLLRTCDVFDCSVFKLILFLALYIYRPQTKSAKVMFSHLSVSHSVHGESASSGVWIHGGLHLGGWANPPPPTTHWILQDMVNERAVRILLECILV